MMRIQFKKAIIFLFYLLFTILLTLPAYASNGLTVDLDEKPLEWNQPIRLVKGRVYLPTRAMVTSLGGEVRWDNLNKEFLIRHNDLKLQMRINELSVKLNEEESLVDDPPLLIENTTYLPLRYIAETLGYKVMWLSESKQVKLKTPPPPMLSQRAFEAEKLQIMGQAFIPLKDMQWWFDKHIQGYQSLPSLYYELAKPYGIRPDVAIAQMIKETGYLKYGNLVQPHQNNFCGIYATGTLLQGNEALNGADANSVVFHDGSHGATFLSMGAGVEAHLQHLYAYAITGDLPQGVKLVDPRFSMLPAFVRGSSPVVAYLGKNENPFNVGWATDGQYGYGIATILQKIYDEIIEHRYRT